MQSDRLATLIDGHLIGISINTQSTSWSTVGQELTDFHRHVIVCPIHANESIHTQPTINSLSIKCQLRWIRCWSSADRVSILMSTEC